MSPTGFKPAYLTNMPTWLKPQGAQEVVQLPVPLLAEARLALQQAEERRLGLTVHADQARVLDELPAEDARLGALRGAEHEVPNSMPTSESTP